MKNTVKLIFEMFAFLAAFNFISCKDPENSGEDATYSESIKIINSYDTKHYKEGLISWFNTTNQKKRI